MTSNDNSGVFQFRPRGRGTPLDMDSAYAPARDLAWNFIPTVTAVLERLRSDRQPAWMQTYCQQHGVTDNDLGVVALSFAKAVELFTNPDVATPLAALQATDFFDTSEAARNVFLMRLGQHVTSMYFASARDVTCPQVPGTLQQQVAVLLSTAATYLESMYPEQDHAQCQSNQPHSASSFLDGCRTTIAGLGICLRAIWRSISRQPDSRTPT